MLSMAPSAGFALISETDWEFIPCAEEAKTRRSLLARISMRLLECRLDDVSDARGTPESDSSLLEQTIAGLKPNWTPDESHAEANCRSRAALNFCGLSLAAPRAADAGTIDWDAAQSAVEARGYSVRVRELPTLGQRTTDDVGTLIPVFEVFQHDRGVISEGRSFDPKVACQIAVAEAIERILAFGSEQCPLVLSNAARLRKRGFIVPNLHVGIRDGFSDELVTLWTSAWRLDGTPAMLPVDIALHDHGLLGYVQSFAVGHTCGLAAGKTIEEAVFSACLEVIERDAYWLAMTTRPLLPDFDTAELCENNPELKSLLDVAKAAGLKVHFKNLQFDWPVPIVHVLLESSHNRLPAFSHGISANREPKKAAIKALMEAFQIRSGQEILVAEQLDATVLPKRGRPAELAWADPAFQPSVAHLMRHPDCLTATGKGADELSANQIIVAIEEVGGKVVFADLGQIGDLCVVRVYVPEAIPPNPNPTEIVQPRLQKWLVTNGLSHPYSDPILT